MTNVRVLLDLRGLVIHSFYTGVPEDTVVGSLGTSVASATHGVKKFIERYLNPILERHAPISIVAVMEGKDGNIRRRSLFNKYKDKPAQDADDRIKTEQRDLAYLTVQKLLLGLGCSLVKTPFAEADDTIAYLCERLKGKKLVYTMDNDLTALHSHDTAVIVAGEYKTSFKGMNFEDGVPTSMVTLYKSIVGDTSDGYPGVKGMGEKAWEFLVKEYGYDGMAELEQIVKTTNFDSLNELAQANKCKALNKLYEARQEWRMCYMLASLRPDWCETSFQEKYVRPQWAKRVPEFWRVEKELNSVGLGALANTYKKWCVRKIPVDRPTYEKLNVEAMVREMRQSLCIPFDYESYDSLKNPKFQEAKPGYVDVLSQKITGCSFAFGNNLQNSVYLSFKHCDTANIEVEELGKLFKLIDTEKQRAELVAHNASFEMTVTLTNLGYTFNRDILDTRTMASHVDENDGLGLKELSKSYLNYDQIKYNDVVKPGEDMRDVSLANVLDYGCDDSICTGHLFVLFQLILECEKTYDFCTKNEQGFDRIMVPSFVKGIEFDFAKLAELEREDTALREDKEAELRQMLKEHCSEINKDGFLTLWGEIESYQRNLLEDKVKAGKLDEAELTEILEEKREETLNACRYNDLSPINLKFSNAKDNKGSTNLVAKALGFPGIRGSKTEWIQKYCAGIEVQAAEQDYKFTEQQAEFIKLLKEAAEDFAWGEEVSQSTDDLAVFCRSVVAMDKSTWDGDELNIDSPKQMAELFYGKMGLPILIRNIDKTDSNARTMWEMEQAPATNVIAIDTWIAEINDPQDWRYKALKLVAELRAVSTRFKLYYRPYPLFKHPVDGRIHPGIKNCGTKTRRPSGTSPNILQVSKTKDEGKMRSCFLPLPNEKEPELIVSIDFVQQELVILAGESQDANLRACYVGDNQRDVHTTTGASIYNVQQNRKGLGSVSYEQFQKLIKDKDKEASNIRKKPAKETNFLMVFGGSAAGLARKSAVPKETATLWVEAFFSTYPGVGEYQERKAAEAKRHGFVTTCFGTRKHCKGVFDKNKAIAASWERQAGNQPIQGGAADALKVVLTEMQRQGIPALTGATIYAPVYDELVASVPQSKVYMFLEAAASVMEMQLPGLDIGLTTSASIGFNWGEQIEIGKRPSKEVVEQEIRYLYHPEERPDNG